MRPFKCERFGAAALATLVLTACQPPSQPTQPETVVEAPAPAPVISYNGITIGWSHDEVLAALGPPPKVLEWPMPGGETTAIAVTSSINTRDYPGWIYAMTGAVTTLHFKDNAVERIVCIAERGAAASCPSIMGVAIGDDEQRIAAALGPPPLPGALPDERAALWYEAKGVALYLTDSRVDGIAVFRPTPAPQ